MLRIALLIFLTGCLAPKKEPPPTPKKEHYLFVLHAESGVFDASGKLTLEGVDSHILYFSSLPIQEAGSLPLSAFLESWDEGSANLANNPPNAGFVFFRITNEKFTDIPIELRKPLFDGKKLEFQATPLLKGQHPKSVKMQEVTLFIDSEYTDLEAYK